MKRILFPLSLLLAGPLWGQATDTPTPGPCCVAVTQLTGFLAPAGLAVDPAAQRLYVADFNNHQVQVFDSNTQAALTILTTANSGTTFLGPIDVALDGAGDLYVADIGSSPPIKKFNSAFTYLGSLGPAGVTAQGVWADVSSVFFSTSDGRVLQYDGATTVYSAAATYGGQLHSPNELQKIGNWLYVTDTLNGQLVKFGLSPPDPSPVTVLTGLLDPSAFRSDPAGNLYIVEGNNGSAPEYLDEFSSDFSVKVQCPFPAVGIWGAAVNGLGQVYVSLINGGSVSLMAGCGLSALPTATPTPGGPAPTPTPTPPDAGCDGSYAYPNPANGGSLKVHLQLCQPATRWKVFVMNTAGAQIGEASAAGATGGNDLSLSIGGWAYGVYYYLVEIDDASGPRRLKPVKFAVVR
ncbi:MAG TPA: NHL repeat-containing protein [bacterium]|nr:NHL repeat-containing protein [bacterium]